MDFLLCWKSNQGLALLVSPPIADSSLEEERSELDYADDPPIPHAEGAAQGNKGVESSQPSKANSLVVDWDGTLSEYLPPHLTPEASSNVLVPLPSRWSGGYSW